MFHKAEGKKNKKKNGLNAGLDPVKSKSAKVSLLNYDIQKKRKGFLNCWISGDETLSHFSLK